jgi:peptide chain release factor 2
VLQRTTNLKERVKRFTQLVTQFDDIKVLWELALEENDESLEGEVTAQLSHWIKQLESMELEVLLSGPYDSHSAIISLHAGAGGTEAQDWVSMLMRMYTRYCERAGYKVEVMDFLAGDEAGVKSVTLSIEGINAYGYLKSEKGVHRLVRISPFDTNGRRHTSFASVDVLPQVEYDDEVEINADDLRIDTYRSGGKGGQHLNKTDSAVRITHSPTGIVVQCQDERSQHSNKDKAMRLLRAKLLELKIQEQEKEMEQLRGDHQEIGWGSQIRSYVFQPYRLIKDHRTGVEVGNVDAVMDGELDVFIAAYLQHFRRRD